jgi:very-short-patch-repair endonuclease
VIVSTAAPPTWHQSVAAAAWASAPEGSVSHRTAARLHHRRRSRGSVVEVLVPRWSRRHLDGVVVHETLEVRAADRRVIDGIPVTSIERTIFDLGGVVAEELHWSMADDAVRRQLTSYEQIRDTFSRLARRGRNGTTATRQLLEARLGEAMTGSDFETMVRSLIRRSGLPPPVVQFPIDLGTRRCYLDLAWPDQKVALECDGWDSHGTPLALQDDLERQNLLVLAGWLVLRVAWRTARDRPELVVDQLRSVLA